MSQTATTDQPPSQADAPQGDLLEKTIEATRDRQRSYSFDLILDPAKYEHLLRVAELYAKSDMVPSHFRGKVGNCFIALQMAVRLGVDPFMFLQKCYVVHGRPAIETQLAVALANNAEVFDGPIRYEMGGEGDGYGCTAWATHKGTTERCEQQVTIGMAKKMGWWTKDGSLWPKMTGQMLKYRSAMWLIRHECPEVIMGLLSRDEVVDTFDGPTVDVTHTNANPSHEAQAEAAAAARESQQQQPTTPEPPAKEDSEEAAALRNQLLEESGFGALLAVADTLGKVDEVAAKIRADIRMGDNQTATLLDACAARKKVIREGRGSGSNKK